ncbi:unnamed protein product [Cyprideis torosa]|uniref:Uncharacterized protein n=1 Tax=Cyprideis torosa TaxID=163714 RepID=A0A7R8WNZ7_9CRUS|nr:unnamed protein product [Cyprideis torosa]CAG0904558.1 unnamed protein product [Cyprideis torosa]
MFDRELCCRQLRYSGMMETIRIRRAGYPIRHTFREFVDRYRFLINGVPPPHKVDCEAAASKICAAVLGAKSDYQLGKTKVFLKDAHDLFLEQERDRMLTRKILIIQKHVKGWYYRRRFVRLRAATLVIQRHWRRIAQRRRFLAMRVGFGRLQAAIRSRILTQRFRHLRSHMVTLQARCRGYLVRRETRKKQWAVVTIQAHVRRLIAQRRYQKMKVEHRVRLEALRIREREERELKKQIGGKRARELAEKNYQERLLDLERKGREEEMADSRVIEQKKARMASAERRELEPVDDATMVEDLFGFLPGDGVSSGEQPPPSAFKDLGTPVAVGESEAINAIPVSPEDKEDLSEYKFQKFAATYFQGNVSHMYSRRPLKQSLLPLETQGDQLAALALWITILRFMGDLPEPKYSHSADKDTTSVMSKVTATLGRTFVKSKEYQDAVAFDEQQYGRSGVAGHPGSGGGSVSNKQKSIRNKLVSLTLKRKNKLGDDVRRKLQVSDGNWFRLCEDHTCHTGLSTA